jgi:hypothetical protein
MDRLAGLRPLELLGPRWRAPAAGAGAGALRAWHRLDQLALRLASALEPHAAGVRRAFELGAGAHRVLLLAHDDRMVLYARPLFRERLRRLLEVRADGGVLVRARDADQRIVCRSRFGISVLGDRIRFEGANGRDRASAWLPWISAEDRVELARRLGRMLDPEPPAAAVVAPV